ncbi:MAG: UDP-3-O-acyl-N-acetylglucosamine deacetylase [Planctomycetia bacterium]
MLSPVRVRSQQTLRRPAVVSGVGYWSGLPNRVEMRPAAAGSGVVFVRDDFDVPVRVQATVDRRVDAVARTNLAVAGVRVQMVEHVLSALAGMEIDCCEIRLTAEELPGLDGSSRAYVDAIEAAGAESLGAPVEPIVVDRIIRVGDESSWIELAPPRTAGLCLEYELEHDHPSIGWQRLSLHVTPESYREQLAAARTFLTEDEAGRLQAAGLGLSVGHRDLIVFGSGGPIDNELRWPDECVRHKMLDLVGDLALVGQPLHASVRARRSGHKLNAEAAACILSCSRDMVAA